MLRFVSYYPMASFLKVELELDEETITESFKSLVAEGKREIQYSDISIIGFRKIADTRWASTGFLVSFLSLMLVAGLYQIPALCGDSFIRGIGQIFFLAGLILCIPGYMKKEYCYFLTKDREYITNIIVNQKNRQDIDLAIEQIKKRTTILSEIHPDRLDHASNPEFELTVRFSPLYFYENTMRFYDDKVVDIDKSLIEDSVSEYPYDIFTSKILINKYGDTRWNSVTLLLFGIGMYVYIGMALFFPSVNLGLVPIAGIIILISLPLAMRYFKEDVLSFLDKNNNVILWTKIPRGEKQKVERIVQFVKEKVASISEHQS